MSTVSKVRASTGILYDIEDESNRANLQQIQADVTNLRNTVNSINTDTAPIDMFSTVDMNLVSGGIGGTGGVTTSATRIRTNSGYTIPISAGDSVWCDSEYKFRIAVYNTSGMTSSTFVAFVNDFTNVLTTIPREYVGKRAAVLIEKVGHETDDISADLATISNHVKYYKPFDNLLYPTLLSSAKDCNTTVNTGIYRWTSTSIPSNVPSEYGGTMIVARAVSSVLNAATAQIVIDAAGNLFERNISAAGTPTDWKRMATKEMVDAVSADKLGPEGRLTANDDIDDVITNGIYYWSSSSVPTNAPFTAGMMLSMNPIDTLTSHQAQIAISSTNLYYRYKSTSGWTEWSSVLSTESLNLFDESKISSNTMVDVTHNDDGTITLSTTSYRSYAYFSIPLAEIEKNTIYQLGFEIVSCTVTDNGGNPQLPRFALRFVGDESGVSHLADGILTVTKPGVYNAGVYTSGFENALRFYVTVNAANATVTIRNVMVAKYPHHLPFIPYGMSASDPSARAIIAGARSDNLSWGKSNVQAQIRQFVNVVYTPLNTLPSQFGDFPAGTPIKGVVYSSARANDRLVGMHISLYTFLSAINNPRSVLYTRKITHNNAKTFYGCVCSAFVNYVLGESINLTTAELWNWDKLKPIAFTAIDIGDIVLTDGHGAIIYDVVKDDFGRIIEVTLAEAGEATVKWTASQSWDSFMTRMSTYEAFRYTDIENVGYTLQPSVRGYLDEVPESIVYPDIMSEYGDEVAILEGEDIKINVIDASGYNSIKVYRDETLIQTISSIQDFTISNAQAGSYEITMTGSTKSSTTRFIVVNANCSYNSNTKVLTFSSSNATPHSVFVYSSYPTNKYVPLTETQLESGSVSLASYVDSEYQYVKVGFMTEYGIATWYSYDLHYWETIS